MAEANSMSRMFSIIALCFCDADWLCVELDGAGVEGLQIFEGVVFDSKPIATILQCRSFLSLTASSDIGQTLLTEADCHASGEEQLAFPAEQLHLPDGCCNEMLLFRSEVFAGAEDSGSSSS
uniref:Secreted protein n=1 Tax=Tetraselmis sp. GSL018 TaxID=582737 RepID=A0A061QUW6_9CHLO